MTSYILSYLWWFKTNTMETPLSQFKFFCHWFNSVCCQHIQKTLQLCKTLSHTVVSTCTSCRKLWDLNILIISKNATIYIKHWQVLRIQFWTSSIDHKNAFASHWLPTDHLVVHLDISNFFSMTGILNMAFTGSVILYLHSRNSLDSSSEKSWDSPSVFVQIFR